MSDMTKKSAVEIEDQAIGDASIPVDAGEQLEHEDVQKLGAVEVDVTPESQVIDAGAMDKELPEEEQVHTILESPDSLAQREKKRTKRQAVMPEGYTVEAGPWERIFQAMKRGYTLAALIVAIDYPDDKPAWMLTFRDYPDIRGVVPAGETDLPDQRLMSFFVGQPINVKIKGLDRENRLVACSRREAVAEARTRLYDEVEEGDLLKCFVKAVVPRSDRSPERLLLDIGGGVLVELKKSQAANMLSQRLSRQYIPGQSVMARVTRIEPNKGIVEVSLKDGDAWDRANIKRGQPISGTIGAIRSNDDGELCYIEPDGWPGLLGIAPLPDWDTFRRRMRVSCKVVNFVGAKHHLRLYIVRRLA
jgi:small subunit ribosomal protein S1